MDTTALQPAYILAHRAKTPFPGESGQYRDARRQLLEAEIEFRRQMTRLVEQRQSLPPGPVIDKDYRFLDADGNDLSLLDLFGAHDTLVTYF